jgi:Animal haem peroxidase
MQRPKLRKLLGLPAPKKATTTTTTTLQNRRRKRQAITYDIVMDNPFLVNDLLPATEERNRRIYDQIAARLASNFRPADGLGPAYTTLTVEPFNAPSSGSRSSSIAFASGNSGSSFAGLRHPSFSGRDPSGSTAFSFSFSSSNTGGRQNSFSGGGGNGAIADTALKSSSFNLQTSHLLRPGQCFPSEELRTCDPQARYRSYSGWCNNLVRPYWGQANTVLRRLFPAAYDDGISKPRSRSLHGTPLPNPRKVSREVHTSESDPDPRYTLMVMQWGQLVDHDLTHAPMVRGHANSVLDCRACDSEREHPACFPIPVPEEDRFFPSTVCIPFTRSNAGQQRLGKH